MTRYILLILFSVLGSCAYNKKTTTPPQKPNVLFIAIDDLRPELGCYGKEYMITPHIDKLAAEGRLFLNHFVNVPTCGASRYSMLTGRYPQTKAQLNNNIFEKQTAGKPVTSLPESFVELLKRNGYYTVGIGKVSHAADGRVYDYAAPVSDKLELPNSWNEFLFNPGKWGTGWNAFFGYANGDSREHLQYNVKPYENADVDDNSYPDGLTSDLAVEKINSFKKQKQPFFLAVGFFKPHLPFTAPKKYWDLYNEKEIPLSAVPKIPDGENPQSLTNSEEFNQYKNTGEKPSLQNRLSDAYARKLRHAYFAATSYVDAQVGKVLNALQDAGLDKNTIVIFWGDNGWHLGDQLVWGKHTLSDYSLRTPFIIKLPDISFPGNASEAVVQSVDIYPTLLDLLQMKTEEKTDGKSVYKWITNPNTNNTGYAYGYFNNGITLRTNRYRVTKYYNRAQQNIELYDYLTDPFETKNIYDENKPLADSLLKILEKGNTGLYQHK